MNKIYETQSYTKTISTTVTSYIEENGKHYITFEDSIFFPEEGGQYADTGVITANGKEIKLLGGEFIKSASAVSTDNPDGRAVLSTAETSIRYMVSEQIDTGTSVECVLDWDIRYSRMQNHSGEHIMSGLIHNKYGLENIGFHLSDDGPVTLTMNGVLSYEQVIEIESAANEIIYANMPITDSYPAKEELKAIDYRSKIDIDGQVRLITIGDETRTVDICACCAPHVKRTGEIGIIKVISVINSKGGIQISILCGKRALEYINHQQNTLNSIAQSLSTHADNVPGLVLSHIEEISRLKSELSELREKEYLISVSSMAADDKHLIFSSDELSALNMKNIFNALTSRFDGFVGVFVGNDTDGYRYYAGSRDNDSKELAGRMREELGAKGGGSSEMIQGKINASRDAITEFWK